MLSIIVAFDEKCGIGKNGTIPWYNPHDLKWFRKTTMGCALIMGRKTFDSIGKPLEGRRTYVLTRQSIPRDDCIYDEPETNTSVFLVPSLEYAIYRIKHFRRLGMVFVAGGESVYQEALNKKFVTKIYATKIKGNYNCDRFFPLIPLGFKVTSVIVGRDYSRTLYRNDLNHLKWNI